MKYKCIKKCYHNDQLFTPGQTLEAKDKPCKWFVASGAYKAPEVIEDVEAKTFAELHKNEAKAVLGKKEVKPKSKVEDDVLD